MYSSRWFSLRTLIGGSIITLVAIAWGVAEWNIPLWFFTVAAIPFVFMAAVFENSRLYLLMVALYLTFQIGVDFWITGNQFNLNSDLSQWFSILIAGEVIFQISSQRRRADQITRRRIRELEVMNDTLTSISGELELNTLLQTITERAANLLGCSFGELLLIDEKTGELEVVAQYPYDEEQIGFRLKLGEGAMGRIAETRRPLLLNDYKSFSGALKNQTALGVEAVLGVPLMKGKEISGVLGVSRHEKNRKFTLDDQRLLTVFATQAMIAIENARLYREIQDLAFTDMLTGIPNRRRLFELAEKEFNRSTRYQRPLSIMILDVDHFKGINDKYGHVVGDQVLKWFACECSMVIRRSIDVIGRFGGEEFAFIYPETDLNASLHAAERLQKHFVKKQISTPQGELCVTFSAGLASLPLHSRMDLDELVERADKALYHAKVERNCIAYWDGEKERPVHLRPRRLLA